MWIVKRRFKNETVPLEIVQTIAHMMLKALDYLHTECQVIHTGKLSQLAVEIGPFMRIDRSQAG